MAEVFVNKDGSRSVTYWGINKDACLECSDVQCVCRVLEQIIDSVSYWEMMKV